MYSRYDIEAGKAGYTGTNITKGKVRAFVFVGNVKRGRQWLPEYNLLDYSEWDKYQTIEDLENAGTIEKNNDYETTY